MKEITIPQNQDIVKLLGINDVNLKYLRKAFPSIDLNVRGNSIFLDGDEKLIADFQIIFDEMVNMNKKNENIQVVKDLKPEKYLEYYKKDNPKVEYRIQIAAVRKLSVIDITGIEAYGEMILEPVPNKSLKRVMVGSFSNYSQAVNVLNQVQSNLPQFKTAFLVKYLDGKRP